jgi:hypothetical protein
VGFGLPDHRSSKEIKSMSHDGDYDHFDDIISETVGALDGTGYSDFQRVDQDVDGDGVVFQFQCQECGRSKTATVEWGELIALHNNVSPDILKQTYPNAIRHADSWFWSPHDNAWAPKIFCPDCHMRFKRPISLRIGEHELAKHIRTGLNRGKIPPQYYQQVDGMCKKLYERGLGAR